MSEQLSNDAALNGIPDGVLQLLSIPGIDPARFRDVTKAFGSLPDEGQVQLADQLIEARSQYLFHNISLAHDTTHPALLRDRLQEIGSTAEKLLRLLQRDSRDGAEPVPWNIHHAITGALPELCRIGSKRRPIQIWNPPEGLSLLSTMLLDLAELGARAAAIYPLQSPKKHGGDRKQGSSKAATNLIERLIDIYSLFRKLYPDSGPAPAVGKPLYQFVRAGLTFTVSTRKSPDGSEQQSLETAFMDPDLPKETRTTDAAIRGVFQRRTARIKRVTA